MIRTSRRRATAATSKSRWRKTTRSKGGQSGQAGGKDQDKQSAQEAGAQSLPGGELTKQEAKDLLNSLKGEEHILPVAADSRTPRQDQPVLKDW